MQYALTILLLLTAHTISAQNQYSPFVGGFEVGTGYSTIIDFNRENNIKVNRDLTMEQLFYLSPFIPYQFGFVTAKYLNHYKYLELGLLFRKTSVGWIQLHYGGWGIPGINLYSFDLPVKYYFPTKTLRYAADTYFGIVPSWLVHPDVYSGDSYDGIEEEYFRDSYVSLCTGITRERGNVRVKMHASMAITSVVTNRYRKDIPREERAYGGVIFPFEILFCWAYITK